MKRVISPAVVAALLTFAAGGAYAANKDGRICTRETVVGSHLPKMVCTTAAERDELRKASQSKVGSLKAQAQVGGSRGAGAR